MTATTALLTAFEKRDRATVVRELQSLISKKPKLGADWVNAHSIADLLGEGTLAIECMRRLLAEKPDTISAQLHLGGTYLKYGRRAEALELSRRIAAENPKLPAAHYLAGYALAQMGETESALKSLRAAIALTPNAGDAWVVLCTLKTFTSDDPELQTLRRVAEAVHDDKPESKGSVFLALGKALDDIDARVEAFAAYQTAAQVFSAQFPYSPAADRAAVEKLVGSFDQAFLRKLAPSKVNSNRPIFVVGLPRSGTTLMEQILTSHSKVANGGELNLMRPALFGLDVYLPEEIDVALASRNDKQIWTKFGEAYLHLLDDQFGPKGHIVDKSLNTSRLLGLALHCLPNAKVIWMQRDARDVAWSAFRTRFGSGEAWSWSLQDMPTHFAAENHLHAHWTKVFPKSILTVRYEDLVNEPNVWIPKALAHCGLSDEAATREFHTNQRAVGTASMQQVRQPLNAKAIGAWRKYETHLAPYFAKLP